MSVKALCSMASYDLANGGSVDFFDTVSMVLLIGS